MTISNRTILIPVDASEVSSRAVRWANEHFVRPEDEIVLLHCFHMPVQPSPRNPDLVRKWEADEVLEIEKATQLLQKLVLLVTTAQVEIKTVPGDPIAMIDGILDQLKPDTIVCGSRGLNQVKRLVQGSLSNHLLFHSSVPVIIVH